MQRFAGCVVLALAVIAPPVAAPDPPTPVSGGPRDAAAIVARIVRADYVGDRAALARLHGELVPLPEDARTASRLLYWRGFALWRRAINGFNDAVDAAALAQDLQGAIAEFDDALRRDPAFVDAKVGAYSCLGMVAYLNAREPAKIQALRPRLAQLRDDIAAAAPANPRMLWARGPGDWSRPGMPPAEAAAREAVAIEGYERGLRLAREQNRRARDPLEPAWGEPELLMSLAWSNLNRTTPDLEAAGQYARQALALVPYWHYVRDILVSQIEGAKAKQQGRRLDDGATGRWPAIAFHTPVAERWRSCPVPRVLGYLATIIRRLWSA